VLLIKEADRTLWHLMASVYIDHYNSKSPPRHL